jgi:mRNA-degrading endonuclease RelE of RelBE toxin-antitoxin system
MKTVVRVSKSFTRQAKPLLKKFASLSGELKQLSSDLSENPFMGTEIMPNVYKIRFAIKSKGKGKSGGARIITFQQKETNVISLLEENCEEYTVYLIAIYDKSKTENISDSEIKKLIEEL